MDGNLLDEKKLAFYAAAVHTGPSRLRSPEISIYVLNESTPDKRDLKFEGVIHTVWVDGTIKEDELGKFIAFADCNGDQIAMGRVILRRFNNPPCLQVCVRDNPKKFSADAMPGIDFSSFAKRETLFSAIDRALDRAVNNPKSKLSGADFGGGI